LDYSAVVFPTGRFKASTYQPPSDGTEHPVRNDVEKFIAEQWKPETYDNAPIALQIVAHRLNEEKVLALLEKVEEALKKH
jgi:amidase